MKKESLNKVMQILNSGLSDPIIFEGVDAKILPNAVIISADIPSSELGVVPNDNGGYKYPAWVMELIVKSKKSDKIYLCIDGLDKVSEDEQNRFYGMFKYGGLNGFKFPKGTQILALCKNANKVSIRLKSLSLIYKAE